MGPWGMLLAVLVNSGLPAVEAAFGDCDGSGAACDWLAYWAGIWTGAIGPWVVAGILFGTLVVWLLLRVCCCCCIALVKCCWKCTTCCCHNRILSNTLIWSVRALVCAAFVIGLAGFILAVLGFVKVNDGVDTTVQSYNAYLNSTLPTQTALTVTTLGTANANLSTVGRLTGQSALLAVLTPAQIGSATTAQEAQVAIWDGWQSTYITPLQSAWRILFWISVATSSGVLLGILLLGLVVRCGFALPFFFTILGFCGAILVWATLGVACVGANTMADLCTSTTLIVANSSYGAGILTKYQCTGPAANGEFAATVGAYGNATAAAVTDAPPPRGPHTTGPGGQEGTGIGRTYGDT